MEEAFTQKIIALAKKYESIDAVQLMPYHQTGIGKAVAVGQVPQAVFATPSTDALAVLAARIQKESGKRTFY